MRFRVYALLLCAVLGPFSSAEIGARFTGEVMSVEQALDRIGQTTGRDYKPGDFQHWLVYLNTKDLAPEEVLESIATAVQGSWSSDPGSTDAMLLRLRVADAAPDNPQKVIDRALPPLEEVIGVELTPERAKSIFDQEFKLRRGRMSSPETLEAYHDVVWQLPAGRYIRAMLSLIPAEDIVNLQPGERVVYGEIDAEGVRQVPVQSGTLTPELLEERYRRERRIYSRATGQPGMFEAFKGSKEFDLVKPLLVLQTQGQYGMVLPGMALVLPDGQSAYRWAPPIDFRADQNQKPLAEWRSKDRYAETESQAEAVRRHSFSASFKGKPIRELPGDTSFEHIVYQTIEKNYDRIADESGKAVVSYVCPARFGYGPRSHTWTESKNLVIGKVGYPARVHRIAMDPSIALRWFERSDWQHSTLPETAFSIFLKPNGVFSGKADLFVGAYDPYLSTLPELGLLWQSGPKHAEALFRSLDDELLNLKDDENLQKKDLSPTEIYWLKELLVTNRALEPAVVQMEHLPVRISLADSATKDMFIWARRVDSGVFFRGIFEIEDIISIGDKFMKFDTGYVSKLEPRENPARENVPTFVRARWFTAILEVEVGENSVHQFPVQRLEVPEPTMLLTLDEVTSAAADPKD
jgi:hypothetical protein